MRELHVKSSAFFNANIDALGNIDSDASISAANNVSAGGSVSAGINMTAGNDITANRNIMAGNTITATNHMRAGGEVSAGGGAITLETDGDIIAARFLDSSDGNVDEPCCGGFGVNPTDHTRLTNLHVHGIADFHTGSRVNIHDEMRIVNASSIGGACAANGLVGRTSSGILLSCENSQWTVPGQPGMYAYFNRTSCPTGWVKANGGNGTRDLRGEFIRSWDNGRGLDSGRSIGSVQGHSLQRHNHYQRTGVGNVTSNSTWGVPDDHWRWSDSNNIPRTGWPSARSFDTGNKGNYDNETRPRNVALLACMKK